MKANRLFLAGLTDAGRYGISGVFKIKNTVNYKFNIRIQFNYAKAIFLSLFTFGVIFLKIL